MRHAIVQVHVHCVNVVIGVLLCVLLVVVRVVPIFFVMLLLIALIVKAHLFLVSIFHVDFAVLEVLCLHSPSVTVDCRQLLPNFNCTGANEF